MVRTLRGPGREADGGWDEDISTARPAAPPHERRGVPRRGGQGQDSTRPNRRPGARARRRRILTTPAQL